MFHGIVGLLLLGTYDVVVDKPVVDVTLRPGTPNRVGNRGVVILHKGEIFFALLLSAGLDDALVFQILPQLVVAPSRVDVILGIVNLTTNLLGALADEGGDAFSSLSSLG